MKTSCSAAGSSVRVDSTVTSASLTLRLPVVFRMTDQFLNELILPDLSEAGQQRGVEE